MQTVTIVCDTQNHSDDNIMSVTMGSKDQILHGYVLHHEKLCKLIWISRVDLDFSCFCLYIVVFQCCN